jgi:hypothetical protein
VIKAVTDACNGVLFVDDRQIDELHAYRGHSPSPRCEVDIEDLPRPPASTYIGDKPQNPLRTFPIVSGEDP